MVRRRTDRSQKVPVRDISGGLLVKLDPARIPTRNLADARNLRFSSGAAETRKGSVRVASFSRPSYALSFPGNTASYVRVRRNAACPIWTGLGPDFGLSFVERPISAAAGVIFALGDTGPVNVLTVYSTDGLDRRVAILEDGATEIDEEIGVVDDTGGAPDDRRYFYHVSREGRVLRTLIVGAAGGQRDGSWTTAFDADDTKLSSAALDLVIGGYGIGGATNGLNSVIDNVTILNRYEEPNRRYYWSAHPMLEDPDLLLRLGFDEGAGGAGTVLSDDSLFGNHGEVVGSPSWVTGDDEELAVGQMLGEVEIGPKLHRLAMAGGVCRREQVR